MNEDGLSIALNLRPAASDSLRDRLRLGLGYILKKPQTLQFTLTPDALHWLDQKRRAVGK